MFIDRPLLPCSSTGHCYQAHRGVGRQQGARAPGGWSKPVRSLGHRPVRQVSHHHLHNDLFQVRHHPERLVIGFDVQSLTPLPQGIVSGDAPQLPVGGRGHRLCHRHRHWRCHRWGGEDQPPRTRVRRGQMPRGPPKLASFSKGRRRWISSGSTYLTAFYQD